MVILLIIRTSLKGTKVTTVGVNQAIVDRDSTNTASASSQSINFLGLTSSYTSPAATKSILVGGTFSNNTNNSVNLTVEIHDSSSNTAVGLAQKIPVPAGSSFVISDTGKTLLEANDSVRVYCDSANAIDVSLSVLQGVSLMADRNGYIGRAPSDSSVTVASQTFLPLESQPPLLLHLDTLQVILTYT